ncbi:MAG: hypothetical protein ACRC7G_08495, partial [Beijerinckiaceae bacterium]
MHSMIWTMIPMLVATFALAKEAPPMQPARSTFNPAKFDAGKKRFNDGILESLENGTSANPGSDNHDHITSFPAPGVIRLGLEGLCPTKGERPAA